jgi:pimeloyl-ACP methyl ester carboxylesterase
MCCFSARHVCTLLLTLFCSSYAAHGAPCNIESATQEVGQGTIAYRSAGTGSEVLLLHGLFAQKEQWDEVLCALAQAGYRASAPDLPGYGQSTGYALVAYALAEQVALLDKFMKARGIVRFHLAGNSMGGAIAAMYANAYPKNVMSLAFIGGTLGIGDWGAAVRQAIFKGTNPFIPVNEAEFELELSLLLNKVPALSESTKSAMVRPYIDNHEHYQQVWNIVNLYAGVMKTMKPSPVPTLILWGERDQVFDATGAIALAKKFPHSRRFLMPDVGHLPMLDAPSTVAAHYTAFLIANAGLSKLSQESQK